MKEFLYIAITVLLVVIYPVLQRRMKDAKVQSLIFWIYIPMAIVYTLLVAYFAISGKEMEDKIALVEGKPGFHEEMWSMMTGIPAEAIAELHRADDAYNAKDYETAFKCATKGIGILENVKDRDSTAYVESEYRQKAGWMYQSAAKAAGRVKDRKLAFQYAEKAVGLDPTSYNHYVLAVAAYNVKRFEDAKENADVALEKGPPQELRGELTELRRRALIHLDGH